MIRRRAPKRATAPPPRSTEAERPTTTSRRPSTVVSELSNLALSSRSRTTTLRRYSQPEGGEVTLPFTLFEFGFPDAELAPLKPSPQFTDEGGERFMNSDAGKQLRRTERLYSAMQRQFINRSVRLAGSSLLVLGCGSSKELIPLLRRGVATAVFVDISQAALDRLRGNLIAEGITATTDVDFIAADAWDYIGMADGLGFDVIMATKCLGLIVGADPVNRKVPDFIEMAASALSHDGSLFVDHHLAFSQPGKEGKRIVDECPPDLVPLATIGGRYSQDVCYSCDVECPEMTKVATFSSPRADHLVQSWQFFHYRRHAHEAARARQTLSAHRPAAPSELALPSEDMPIDSTVDTMIPVNAKGVKRIVVPSDILSHDISRARVKFDGSPGVLVLDGSLGLFLSPNANFCVDLPRSVEPTITLMAELVRTSAAFGVLVATGLVAIGERRSDPLDQTAFNSVVPAIEKLLPAGIMPSVPELIRYVDQGVVRLTSSKGVVLKLPVDGVQLHIAGRNGVFVKTASDNSVDAKSSDAEKLLLTAYDAIGTGDLVPTVDTDSRPGVFEYRRVEGTHVWRQGRFRPDKSSSDGVGAVVHTVIASVAAEELHLGKSPGDIIGRVLR
nr:methyl transferase [Metarhizium brunneum polymycovirus 1]